MKSEPSVAVHKHLKTKNRWQETSYMVSADNFKTQHYKRCFKLTFTLKNDCNTWP